MSRAAQLGTHFTISALATALKQATYNHARNRMNIWEVPHGLRKLRVRKHAMHVRQKIGDGHATSDQVTREQARAMLNDRQHRGHIRVLRR